MDRELHGTSKTSGNEPARRISMELLGEGARVTRLSLDGSRLKLTIEAELAGSHLETTGSGNAAPLMEQTAGGFGNDVVYAQSPGAIELMTPVQKPAPPASEPRIKDEPAVESESAPSFLSDTLPTLQPNDAKPAEPPARAPQPAPIPIPLAPPIPAPAAALSLALAPSGGEGREEPEPPARVAPPPVLSPATPPPADKTPTADPAETVRTEKPAADALQLAMPTIGLGSDDSPADKPAEKPDIAVEPAETPAAKPEAVTEIDLPVFSLAPDPLPAPPPPAPPPAADATPPEAVDNPVGIDVDIGDALESGPGFGDGSTQPAPAAAPPELDPMGTISAAPPEPREKKPEPPIGEISLGDFGDIAIAPAFQSGQAPASAAEKPKKEGDSGGVISIGDDFGFGIAFDAPPSSPVPKPERPAGATIPLLNDIALDDIPGSGQPVLAPPKAPPPVAPKFDNPDAAVQSGGSWGMAAQGTIPSLSEPSGTSPAPTLAPPLATKSKWDAEPEQSAPPPPPPLPQPPPLSAWESASGEPDKELAAEESSAIGGERHGEPQPAMAFGFGQEAAQPPEPEEKPAPPPERKKTPEAGGTTVLIRYTCPKCKTQGMQAVDKVGTVVHCSNCGKAMRLVMKK